MRETYFRAWDTYNQAWADEYLAITEDGYVVEIKNDGTTEYWKDRFIIEFGTGLKDKNGKEICEGDIARCSFGESGVVELRHGAYCVVGDDIADMSNWKESAYEIIGNIHEAPELIEKDKQ